MSSFPRNRFKTYEYLGNRNGIQLTFKPSLSKFNLALALCVKWQSGVCKHYQAEEVVQVFYFSLNKFSGKTKDGKVSGKRTKGVFIDHSIFSIGSLWIEKLSRKPRTANSFSEI